KFDEVNRMAGLPPRELYIHSSGAGWDFMLIQPADTPPEAEAAMDAAWDKLGLPSGADYFIEFRQYIADHEDSIVKGPTTAADFLATRKKKYRRTSPGGFRPGMNEKGGPIGPPFFLPLARRPTACR